MNRRVSLIFSLLVLIGVSLTVPACGRKAAEGARTAAAPLSAEERAGTWMVYRLDGGFSHYRYVEIMLNGEGRGSVTYAVYGGTEAAHQPATVPIALAADRIDRFITLFNKIDFFSFRVRNRNKNRISAIDTGTTTLTFRSGGRTRTISYGYVKNDTLQELTGLFWSVARPRLPPPQNE